MKALHRMIQNWKEVLGVGTATGLILYASTWFWTYEHPFGNLPGVILTMMVTMGISYYLHYRTQIKREELASTNTSI